MPAKKKAAATEKAESNGTRNNLGAAARGAAMKRMIESYPEAWGDFLREEREKIGLNAETGRKTRVQMLAAKMLEAGVERDDVNKALEEAGFKAKI